MEHTRYIGDDKETMRIKYSGWSMLHLAFALNAEIRADGGIGWRQMYAMRVNLVEKNSGNDRLRDLMNEARQGISAVVQELSYRLDGELVPSGD